MTLFKWPGGKRKLLPEIKARIPYKFNRYFEPCIGGGALFFELAEEHTAVIADASPHLISVYAVIRDSPDAVINQLQPIHDRWQIMSDEERRQQYLTYRCQYNAGEPNRKTPFEAALFMVINRTGFNGLWRVNKKGECNVPYGRYANPTICDPELIRHASRLLQKRRGTLQTSIYHGDFSVTTSLTGEGDFVYIDPPYWDMYTQYTRGKFSWDDQVRVRDTAVDLGNRGVKVLLSNSNRPEIRELYQGFCIDTVSVRHVINNDGNGRGHVGEVLIRNYD